MMMIMMMSALKPPLDRHAEDATASGAPLVSRPAGPGAYSVPVVHPAKSLACCIVYLSLVARRRLRSADAAVPGATITVTSFKPCMVTARFWRQRLEHGTLFVSSDEKRRIDNIPAGDHASDIHLR